MTTFHIIVLLLQFLPVSILIFTHRHALFPGVDTWDGDKGHLVRGAAIFLFLCLLGFVDRWIVRQCCHHIGKVKTSLRANTSKWGGHFFMNWKHHNMYVYDVSKFFFVFMSYGLCWHRPHVSVTAQKRFPNLTPLYHFPLFQLDTGCLKEKVTVGISCMAKFPIMKRPAPLSTGQYVVNPIHSEMIRWLPCELSCDLPD